MNPGDAPDVVEDHVVARALGDHAARLEDPAWSGRADEIGEVAFPDEDHDRVRVTRHVRDSIAIVCFGGDRSSKRGEPLGGGKP